MSWSADDTILIGQGPRGIWQVSGEGGTPDVLIPVGDGEQAFQPVPLPDGDTVILTLVPAGAALRDETLIVAASLSTGDRRVLIEGGANALYTSTGHLVYMREGTLHGVTLNLDRLAVTGPPVRLGERIAVASAVGTAQFGLSRDGFLVYAGTDAIRTERRLVWVDRSGQETAIDLPVGAIGFLTSHPTTPV